MVDEANVVLLIIAGTSILFIFVLSIITFTTIYKRGLVQKDTQYRLSLKNKELELLKAVIDTQEAEREKIALNLHDEVGPLLSSIKFKLARYKKEFQLGKLNENTFSEDSEFIDQIIRNVRGVSHDLSPQQVVKFGLAKAIETFTVNLEGIDCMVVSELDEEATLNKQMSRNLYCIILELLNNIIKHDSATWMEIEFFEEDSMIKVRINHDGKGVTNEEFAEFELNSKGLGLSSVKSRLLVLNATLNFSKVHEMSNTEIVVPFG